MTEGLNPYKPVEEHVRRRGEELRAKVAGLWKRYATLALAKTGIGTALAIGAVALRYPPLVAGIVAVVLVAMFAYLWGLTIVLKRRDAQVRWAFIELKRLEKELLRQEIAVDTTTLGLLGQHSQPGGRRRPMSSELRQALSLHTHRLRLSEERATAAEAVRDGTATDVQRRAVARRASARAPVPPTGPPPGPIQRRRDVADAKLVELEAEIQALATYGDVDDALAAAELAGVRRSRKEIEDAARQADKSATDRVARGLTATSAEPAHIIDVSQAPNGQRTVTQGRDGPTPEQIARGEGQDEAAAST